MTLLALSTGDALREVGMVLGGLAALGAFFLPQPRARAAAVVCVLVLAPALVVSEVWSTPALVYLRSAPLVLGPVLAVGALATAALTVLFVRRPSAVAVLAAAALPFRVPVSAGGQTANLLVPLYLVVGAGGLAYAWTRLRRGAPSLAAERRPGALELTLLLAVVLYALQASYSTDFGQALENVAFFYLPFALLLKLLIGIEWSPRLLRRCLVTLVALALAFVLVGFVEYATGRLLLNPKVIAANEFESFFRVNSLFFDPNVYGRFLAVVILLVTGALLWSRRPRAVAVAAAVLVVLFAGLVLAFSQSSYAALLLGLAVLAGAHWGWRPVAAAAGVVMVLAIAVVLLAPQALRVDLGSEYALDAATSGRVGLTGGGLALWAERPLLGHGAGSFAERFRVRRKASSQAAVAASHTIPITVSAEQGLAGLAAYLAVLVAAGRLLAGGRGRSRSPAGPSTDPYRAARVVVAAAFAALVLHTLLYAAFLEDPLSWALLGVAIGLSARPAAADAPEETPALSAR